MNRKHIFIYILIIFLFMAFIPVALGDNWVTKQGDYNHTGIASSDIGGTFYLNWSKKLVGTFDEFAGALVVNGYVITVPKTTETKMYSTNITTHAERWSYPVGAVDATPLYYNGIFYVQNTTGTLFAIYENGSLAWSNTNTYNGIDDTATVTISINDNAVFASQQNILYSYDLDTGVENWNTNLTWFNSSGYSGNLTYGILYNNGFVFVSGYDKTASTTSKKFTSYYSINGTYFNGTYIGKRGVWDSDISINNSILFTGTTVTSLSDIDVYAIYPNGTVKWTKTFDPYDYVLTTPAIKNGVVWITTTKALGSPIKTLGLYGINEETGTILYQYNVSGMDQSYSSIVLGTDYLYTTFLNKTLNTSVLYSFDYTANLKDTYNFNSRVYASTLPLVDGKLYLTADDGYLYVFSNPPIAINEYNYTVAYKYDCDQIRAGGVSNEFMGLSFEIVLFIIVVFLIFIIKMIQENPLLGILSTVILVLFMGSFLPSIAGWSSEVACLSSEESHNVSGLSDTWINLNYGNIKNDSEVISNSTYTGIYDTDYLMDYVNGRFYPKSTGSFNFGE